MEIDFEYKRNTLEENAENRIEVLKEENEDAIKAIYELYDKAEGINLYKG